MTPVISIVTVVLNDLNGLLRTQASIVSQNYLNYEWVIIDGGSTDGSAEHIKNNIADSAIWVSEPDQGIYDAMNKGIALSSGNYVVFLNAGDCFPSTDILEKVAHLISATNQMVDVLFGGANLRFSEDKAVYRGPKPIESYIWHGLPANHQATYYKNILLKQYNYDISFKICGDYYIIARLYKQGITVAYLDSPLVDFEFGGLSHNSKIKLWLEPYRIQKEILNRNIIMRLCSLSRRILATMVAVMLFRL